ncbi:hypothetical protein AVEN_231482-1 [Araneus ventricosus]|uniref:Uncharacterized protein n=1 Tax=Araneus ventricosus TaxID=182803 RepID=A0A4Y2IWG4_ARAVE|nr:hypothetical protein AVEN_231482-1 [Araneus ventricosus]
MRCVYYCFVKYNWFSLKYGVVVVEFSRPLVGPDEDNQCSLSVDIRKPKGWTFRTTPHQNQASKSELLWWSNNESDYISITPSALPNHECSWNRHERIRIHGSPWISEKPSLGDRSRLYYMDMPGVERSRRPA